MDCQFCDLPAGRLNPDPLMRAGQSENAFREALIMRTASRTPENRLSYSALLTSPLWILVLALTVVYMHTQKKTQQRQTWERQITTKLEAADLAGVGLLVEQVQDSAPDIHQTAEIQGLIRRYKKALRGVRPARLRRPCP